MWVAVPGRDGHFGAVPRATATPGSVGPDASSSVAIASDLLHLWAFLERFLHATATIRVLGSE
jgi:hypothetical protein